MATVTTNYSLTKPELADAVDICVLNQNFDKIDEQLKINEDSIPPVATPTSAGIVKPDGVTIMVDENGTICGAQTYVLPRASGSILGGVKVGANLNVDSEGKLHAYLAFTTDTLPTSGSKNVPLSGGTYQLIDTVDRKVEGLSSQVTSLVTGVVWKSAVDTFDGIATAYPAPTIGWTVMCLDTGRAYQWDGTAWNIIFSSLISVQACPTYSPYWRWAYDSWYNARSNPKTPHGDYL